MSEIITLSSDDEENNKRLNKEKSNHTKIKKEDDAKDAVVCKVEHTEDENNIAMFKRFLSFCTDVEVGRRKGSPRTMNRITDKFMFRYKHADPEYTKSHSFLESLSAAKKMVEKDPCNLFVHMKLVVDELKVRSKKKVEELKKRKLSEDDNESVSNKRLKSDDDSQKTKFSRGKPVNEKHVKKLEEIFQKVYRKVKKLEEKEVDWDEEENSAYLRLERYKQRLYCIWEKWQEVRGCVEEVKRLKYIRIAFSGTDYPKLNHAIEHHVNKTQAFPDFFDILKLTSDTLKKEEEKSLSQEKLRKIASAAFQKLGDQLQKRRVYEFWNSCHTYFPNKESNDIEIGDPADKDEKLAEALHENQRQNKEKLNKIINDFVERQVEAKLEPEEVLPGKEDEDSKSEEEEEKEDEVDEEDMIVLSSTSEESGTEENRKENGISDAKHSENGKVDDVESSSDNENKVNEKKKNSGDIENKKSSKTLMKKESKPDLEPIASCSLVSQNSKLRIKSVAELTTKNKDDDDGCVVLLSDSEH